MCYPRLHSAILVNMHMTTPLFLEVHRKPPQISQSLIFLRNRKLSPKSPHTNLAGWPQLLHGMETTISSVGGCDTRDLLKL
ncbi:hypothetical protein BDR05DRAFT_956706, partial [Suillus weaverae]